MSFKPWKQPLLATAALLAAGTPAAIAQNVQPAQRAIELGRYNEARAALRNNPSPEATFELGRLYQKRDMPDSAAFYFRKASSDSPLGRVAAGRALLAKGQAGPAEEQFAAAAKIKKNRDPQVLTMIAQAYAESDVKDISKAKEYVNLAQTANKKNVDEPNLMVARGDIFLHSDAGGGEAMNSYDRATNTNPSFAGAYFRKGVLNVRSRNFNEARTNLNKAIELDPSYAPAYRELADMYYFAGQYEEALKAFQQYLGLAEKSDATDAQYASFLFLTKKYPDALTIVNKVLEREPNNLTMNRLKAYSLFETSKFDEAAQAMDTFMRVAPADKILKDDYLYQGKILARAGRNEEAVAILDKQYAQYADADKQTLMDIASAYINAQAYPQAAKVYKRILNMPGSDLADQARYAIALTQNKQYMQADSIYGVILKAKPDYIVGYRTRARVNFSMDPDSKQGLAKPYYEEFLKQADTPENMAKYTPDIIEANNYLGYYYLQQGKKTEALPYYQKILMLDPANQDALTAVGIINEKPSASKSKK